MTTDDGWTDNPAELFRQRVVLAMATGENDCVDIAHAVQSAPQEVGDMFDLLATEGLAGCRPRRMAPGYTTHATLTPAGRAMVAQWNAARTAGNTKRACTSAMLAWLDALDGEAVSTDKFLKDVRAHHFGEPFNERLAFGVAKELLRMGLIRGTGSWGGPVIGAEITRQGRLVCRQHAGDLDAWTAAQTASGGTVVNVHGSTGVNVAANSPGAQQSVTLSTEIRDQVLTLASALDVIRLEAQLEPVDLARAAGLVGQLREAAEGGVTEPGRMQRLLEDVKKLSIGAIGGAGGQGLYALVEAIMANL
jgi:hypothetical protein